MAMADNSIPLATIALSGTICTGFFALLGKLSKSMDRLTDSNTRIADEAKQRNGHLAELVIKTTQDIKDSMDKPVNVQTVETQVVKEQK